MIAFLLGTKHYIFIYVYVFLVSLFPRKYYFYHIRSEETEIKLVLSMKGERLKFDTLS